MPKIVNFKNISRMWYVYLYVLPSLLLVVTFAYLPCASAIYHAFFRWNGNDIENFVGLRNFHRIFGWSPTLWVVYGSWVFFLMATITGKPVSLKDRAPLAVLALAWTTAFIILSGSFTNTKVLNLDAGEAAGWFGRTLICTTIGVLVHYLFRARWSGLIQGLLVLYGFLFFFYKGMVETGDQILWSGFAVTFILVVANLFKMIPSIVTAVMIHRLKSERMQYAYRVLFVVPMIIPGMVYLLIWKFFFDPKVGALNKLLHATGGMDLLVMMNDFCGWKVFVAGQDPAWLGDVNLIIPSLILWGFPWVGVVGVLIYLAGLSSIGTELYEAADIDGIGWFKKFLYIELPLIATQVRINLIMMIIGTLQGYAFILILLGDGGGPKGVALVPGLYMFRNAFSESYAGYACAIGLVLFVFILILTEINNRYVRVEK